MTLSPISAYTPINYDYSGREKTYRESAQEVVGNYLSFFAGRQVFIIPSNADRNYTEETAVVVKDSSSRLSSFLKVASLFTLVIPALMLIANYLLSSKAYPINGEVQDLLEFGTTPQLCHYYLQRQTYLDPSRPVPFIGDFLSGNRRYVVAELNSLIAAKVQASVADGAPADMSVLAKMRSIELKAENVAKGFLFSSAEVILNELLEEGLIFSLESDRVKNFFRVQA